MSFRVKAPHCFIGDFHPDARDSGLSPQQVFLTASQDKVHYCVCSVLVNIKSAEATNVSVLHRQFCQMWLLHTGNHRAKFKQDPKFKASLSYEFQGRF